MKSKKITKSLLSLLIAVLVAFTGITVTTPTTVHAATTYELGINATLKLDVKAAKGATVTYKSSKPSVASVSKKGIVTGKKVGTTTVKATVKKKGQKAKTTTYKIQVKKAYLTFDLETSLQKGYLEKYPYIIYEDWISCRNPKATYKFYSATPSLIQITTAGKVTSCNAKAGDWTDIIVKETYKGKTREVGHCSLVFSAPQIYNDSVTFHVGDVFNVGQYPVSYMIGYRCTLTDHLYSEQELNDWLAHLNDDDDNDDDDSDVLQGVYNEEGYWTGEFYAQKKGTCYLYLAAYDYSADKYEYLGTPVTVTVVK